MKKKIFVVEKKNLIWIIVGAVVAAAAIGAVVFAIFHKRSAKKKALANVEESPVLEAETAEEGTESAPFEVPADAVIADAENMEAAQA